MGDFVTLLALFDVLFHVPVDAWPRTMAKKDFGHSFVARVASEYAAVSVAKYLRYHLGWNNCLEYEG